MKYNTLQDIVNAFVKKAQMKGTELSYLKLECLLFYLQGQCLAKYDTPAFNEDFSAQYPCLKTFLDIGPDTIVTIKDRIHKLNPILEIEINYVFEKYSNMKDTSLYIHIATLYCFEITNNAIKKDPTILLKCNDTIPKALIRNEFKRQLNIKTEDSKCSTGKTKRRIM